MNVYQNLISKSNTLTELKAIANQFKFYAIIKFTDMFYFSDFYK